MELTPQMQEDGTFYLDSARTLTHLIVADFPAGLQGISLNSSSIKINRGQKHTLKVVPIPESVTENYNVTWKSSNTSIAKVSEKRSCHSSKEWQSYDHSDSSRASGDDSDL